MCIFCLTSDGFEIFSLGGWANLQPNPEDPARSGGKVPAENCAGRPGWSSSGKSPTDVSAIHGRLQNIVMI